MHSSSLKKSGWYLFFLYICCYGVVLLYVNTFSIWAWARAAFGTSANYVPVVLTGLLLLSLGWYFLYAKQSGKKLNSELWLYASIALSVAAFFLPDPNYPIKRIHVVQYFLLTFLVRYPLSRCLRGNILTFYTFLVTFLFGIHDELLQGIHPLRTFGLRDIMVNGCAALAGSLFTHFIRLYAVAASGFEKYQNQNSRTAWVPGPQTRLTLVFLMATAVVFYLIPLPNYRNNILPYWLLSPLMGTLAASVFFIDNKKLEHNNHGLTVCFWLLFLLPAYQVIANVSPVQFN